MTTENYIDTSVSVARALDLQALSKMQAMPPIGRGKSATVFPLGIATIANQKTSVCLKLGTYPHRTDERLISELTIIDIMTRRAPQLQRLFPWFMVGIAIEQPGNIVGILTEDVTHGGKLPHHPMAATAKSMAELKAAVQTPDEHDCLAYGSLGQSVAFNVGGEEKWLDLTPRPFIPMRSLVTEYRHTGLRAEQSLPELTCTVLGSSALALSVGSYLSGPQ